VPNVSQYPVRCIAGVGECQRRLHAVAPGRRPDRDGITGGSREQGGIRVIEKDDACAVLREGGTESHAPGGEVRHLRCDQVRFAVDLLQRHAHPRFGGFVQCCQEWGNVGAQRGKVCETIK
jgi:hypothetical protein